jgi:hypothetical protein
VKARIFATKIFATKARGHEVTRRILDFRLKILDFVRLKWALYAKASFATKARGHEGCSQLSARLVFGLKPMATISYLNPRAEARGN